MKAAHTPIACMSSPEVALSCERCVSPDGSQERFVADHQTRVRFALQIAIKCGHNAHIHARTHAHTQSSNVLPVIGFVGFLTLWMVKMQAPSAFWRSPGLRNVQALKLMWRSVEVSVCFAQMSEGVEFLLCYLHTSATSLLSFGCLLEVSWMVSLERSKRALCHSSVSLPATTVAREVVCCS